MRNIEWIIFVCHHDGTNLSSGCPEQPRIIHSITLRDHTRHRMKFFLNQVPYLTYKEGISKVSRILYTFFSFGTWDLTIKLAKLKLIAIKLLFYLLICWISLRLLSKIFFMKKYILIPASYICFKVILQIVLWKFRIIVIYSLCHYWH